MKNFKTKCFMYLLTRIQVPIHLTFSIIDSTNKYKAEPILFDAIKLLYMADVTSYISQIKVKNVINATLWTNKVILDSVHPS